MTVLVLGAAGMLGHKVLQVLEERSFSAAGTVRDDPAEFAEHPALGGRKLIGGVDVGDFDQVARVLADRRPAAVVNCVGIIPQSPGIRDECAVIRVNALFPRQLARACAAAGIRLIHISTDCVFSGRTGGYREGDEPDEPGLYGRTKALGEVAAPGCLTLRTSLIGRELVHRRGLLEWLIGNRGGRVTGYGGAVFSGLTTRVLAVQIAELLVRHPDLHGLWHVSAQTISKYELLRTANEVLRLGITVGYDDSLRCDRSLDGSRFRERTGFGAPAWRHMIEEVAADPVPAAPASAE